MFGHKQISSRYLGLAWIPVFTGMTGSFPQLWKSVPTEDRGNMLTLHGGEKKTVIPAEAGIQSGQNWIPDFAGMTYLFSPS